MFGFYLKKTLCDIWDNLFHSIVVNFFTIAVALVCFALWYYMGSLSVPDYMETLVTVFLILVTCMIMGVVLIAEGDNCARIANFETAHFGLYFKNLIPSLKDGLLFGLIIAAYIIVAMTGLPYYFRIWLPEDGSQGSLLGLFLMSIVFWFEVISVFSLQWFIAVRSLMHNSVLKTLKKCYIIFFDNVWFSIGVFVNNIVIAAISVFTFGIICGSTGLTISVTDALRLRLYKYDWLEVNPDLTPKERKDVPWADLIAKDKKILGPRKFKSFIFPWKE